MDATRMVKWLESMRNDCRDEYDRLNDPRNRMEEDYSAHDDECDDDRMIEVRAEIRLLETILAVVRRTK